jgi:hypothetical protein
MPKIYNEGERSWASRSESIIAFVKVNNMYS